MFHGDDLTPVLDDVWHLGPLIQYPSKYELAVETFEMVSDDRSSLMGSVKVNPVFDIDKSVEFSGRKQPSAEFSDGIVALGKSLLFRLAMYCNCRNVGRWVDGYTHHRHDEQCSNWRRVLRNLADFPDRRK